MMNLTTTRLSRLVSSVHAVRSTCFHGSSPIPPVTSQKLFLCKSGYGWPVHLKHFQFLRQFSSCFKKSLHTTSSNLNREGDGSNAKHDPRPARMMSRPKTRQPVKFVDAENTNKVCITYATADHYRFVTLADHMARQSGLQQINLPADITNAVIYQTTDDYKVRTNGNGYVVFFREGAVSFWNISETMIKEIIRLTRTFEIESYKVHLVKWESEQMNYKFVPGKSRFIKTHFELDDSNDHDLTCSEMYAFSNALVVSVKLAHWEHSLDKLIQSIESMPRALMRGNLLRYQTPKLVLQKIGEVFMIRHRLNLQYNLLDVPDVYWDREELEKLYVETTEFLNIPRRVKIMNEKLSYCAHMVELVKSHLAEQKSLRVEILIVLLILIEVLFEIMHFYVKPYILENHKEESSN